MRMGRLQVIIHEEYILSNKDFKIEKCKREKEGIGTDNKMNFFIDLSIGNLARHQGTFVAYKDGVLCGQSRDRDKLLENASYEFFTPNLSLFKVPKNREKLEILYLSSPFNCIK